jgi:elongation factor P
MANTGDVSVGTVLRYNGELCQIIEWQHRTPGNLRAFYQGKMKNLKTGKTVENRFRSVKK